MYVPSVGALDLMLPVFLSWSGQTGAGQTGRKRESEGTDVTSNGVEVVGIP